MYGRLPILKMLAVTVVLTVAISAVMVSINWNGVEGSTAAPKIDTLLDVMIVLSSFVFSLVMVMLGYASQTASRSTATHAWRSPGP